METIRRVLFAAGLVFLAVRPAAVAAQATVSVPVQDPVYRDLDRLIGTGMIETAIIGQRPYSRREIARMVSEASRRVAAGRGSESNRRIVARLQALFADELRMLRGDSISSPRARLDEWSLQALGVSSPSRIIQPDSLGSVAADLDPLLNGRGGRIYRNGLNAAAEVDASFRVSRSLIFRARPRLLLAGAPSFAAGSIQALSGTFLYRNVMLEVGRQPMVWGQGMEGAFLGSTSGPALDMVRLATDAPFYAPSILRYLGPLRGTLVYIDLGPNQTFPHSNIIAYKLSANPISSRFELSASVLAEQGGRGAPTASLWDHIEDIIPVLKYTLPDNNSQFSNKIAGWEYRLRLPELRGTQLYLEHQFEDMDPRRWRSTFWQDGSHDAGISVANLAADGALGATAEFHHTGLRAYVHQPFTSGIAFNRVLLGDPLGPKGDAGYLRLHWDRGGRSSFTLDGAIERRLGDVYVARSSPEKHESDFHFVLLQSRPAEWRRRMVGSWIMRESAGRRLTFDAGYERAQNFRSVAGADRNNFLAGVTLDVIRW